MSYFIIPKINNIITVNPTVEENMGKDPSYIYPTVCLIIISSTQKNY